MEDVGKKILDELMPRWVKAPEGSECLDCKSTDTLERSLVLSPGFPLLDIIMGSPYSGMIRCTACGYKDTVMSYLGRSCFKVEPLNSVTRVR